MRSRKVLLSLTCLAASTTLLVDTAHADRRTGLAGNLLIQDPDDLFPFPQYTLTHRNMIRLDYGGSSTSGNGVLTLGDENIAFGVALHRGDILSPDIVGFNQELAWLGGVSDPFANQAGAFGFVGTAAPSIPGNAAGPVVPATVFDVMMGLRLSGTSSLGARVGLGRGVQQTKNDGDVSGLSQTFIAAQVGFSSLPEDGLRLDLSGNIVLAFANQDLAGNDVASGTNARFGVLGRGYYPLNEVVDIGVLANVQLENEATEVNGPPKVNRNVFNGGLMAGVGPAINLERAKIAAYAGLTMGFGKYEPNKDTNNDEVGNITFAAPMVNMATEVQLLDWMYVRTGAQYTWSVTRNKYEPDTKDKIANGAFNWSAGLGVTKNNFYLDGVIQNAFMTNGPAFVGGGTPGFLAMASITYKFGDVFSGAVSAPAEVEPAPAPVAPEPVAPAVVEPPVQAEPDQELAPPSADASGAATSTGSASAGTASGKAGVSGGLSIGR